jgi:hypothetical protein
MGLCFGIVFVSSFPRTDSVFVDVLSRMNKLTLEDAPHSASAYERPRDKSRAPFVNRARQSPTTRELGV